QLLALSSAAILLAAIVRGFSGFGFSLLSITAISLILPVAQIVPSIFLLEIAASINLIPGIWREIHWRSLTWLMVGYVIGLPLGGYALIHAPEAPAQIVLGIFVIGTAILMLRGFHLARTPAAPASTATGAASGVLNGAFGIGGPPVVLFYFSTPGAAAIGRASIIFFFLFTDLLGVCYFATQGIVTAQSFVQAALWLPALLIGVWIGAHGFRRMNQDAFRRWVLVILIALALLGIGKAALSLMGSA
ncbi:MAG TPA: sulfite exporter TauE/SafE family protein, partial [Dongiaceae bacterium]|nr:sulfite exporter TauE/SafE family protein [Dongiaceae bacterium]